MIYRSPFDVIPAGRDCVRSCRRRRNKREIEAAGPGAADWRPSDRGVRPPMRRGRVGRIPRRGRAWRRSAAPVRARSPVARLASVRPVSQGVCRAMGHPTSRAARRDRRCVLVSEPVRVMRPSARTVRRESRQPLGSTSVARSSLHATIGGPAVQCRHGGCSQPRRVAPSPGFLSLTAATGSSSRHRDCRSMRALSR